MMASLALLHILVLYTLVVLVAPPVKPIVEPCGISASLRLISFVSETNGVQARIWSLSPVYGWMEATGWPVVLTPQCGDRSILTAVDPESGTRYGLLAIPKGVRIEYSSQRQGLIVVHAHDESGESVPGFVGRFVPAEPKPAEDEEGPLREPLTLRLMHSQARVLVTVGPSSQWIAIEERQQYGTYQRYRSDPYGKQLRLVGESIPADGPNPYPDFREAEESPDRQWRVETTGDELVLRSPAGESHSFPYAPPHSVHWAPDSSGVVFPTGNGRLVVASVDGTERQVSAGDYGSLVLLGWSPAGIDYVAWGGVSDHE